MWIRRNECSDGGIWVDFDLINMRVQDREQSWANGNPVTALSKVGNYNIEILLEALKVRAKI